MGTLITVLVYVPAGEPDAGEVTWSLALFTVIAGWIIGSSLRDSGSPRAFLAGEAIRGLGIGSAIGLALLLFISLIWWLVTGAIT